MRARLLLCLVAACACAATARAEDGQEPVEAAAPSLEILDARVVLVRARIVTIDRGRAAGLLEGDRVRFFPPGAPSIEGVVRTVEDDRAHVELERIEPAIDPGVRAEVELPDDRLAAREEEIERAVPEHPGWEQPIDAWDEGAPLLAPARSPEPEDRASDLFGRAYTRLDYSDDRQGEGRQYLRSLTGLDFDWTNPFGQGGRVQFDGEFSYRDAQLGEDGGTEDIARIERLSYAVGGIPGRPNRFELGRFLQSEFPELGVLDGIEYVHRPEAGHRFGASVGFLPLPFDEMRVTDDLALAAFYRYVSDVDETFAVGAAYQKTWHDGEADRDLVVSTLDWRLAERTTFRGSAWLDVYGANERVKEEGVELTQLYMRLDQRFEAPLGFGLYASRVRWPDVKRDELPPATPDAVADNEVSRAGVDAWGQATSHLRLGARLEGWEDQVASGTNGELRFGLRDWLYDEGSVDLSLYGTQGRFSDGLGARVTASRWLGRSVLRLSYEVTEYEQQDFSGEQESLLQQGLRAGIDTGIGRDWSLSLDAEARFGDQQDALVLGFFLQRSF